MSTQILVVLFCAGLFLSASAATLTASSTACSAYTVPIEDLFPNSCPNANCVYYYASGSSGPLGTGRHCNTPKNGLTTVASTDSTRDDTFTGYLTPSSNACAADTSNTAFAQGCTQPLTNSANCVLWLAGQTGRHCLKPITGYYANTFAASADQSGATDDAIIKCDSTCASCLRSTANACTNCAYGKYGATAVSSNSPGTCALSCDKSCASCTDGTAAKCTSCGVGYFGTVSTQSPGTCAACDKSCAYCTDATAAKCTACAVGYYGTPSGTTPGTCASCDKSCASCTDGTAAKCTSCAAGYYGSVTPTSAGTCATCPTGCKTCVSGTVCSACNSGYTLSSTGTCTFAERLGAGLLACFALFLLAAF